MGQPTKPPGASAHGEAKLSLYLDGAGDDVQLIALNSWWTSDGECKEASLQLQGETGEAYELLQEAALWVWKRWKRPIAEHGPFS